MLIYVDHDGSKLLHKVPTISSEIHQEPGKDPIPLDLENVK